MSEYEYTRIVRSVIGPRLRAAAYLGIPCEELESLGALAALEAAASWDPRSGRKLSSWIYRSVEYAIRKRLTKIAREFADDEMDAWVESSDQDPETRVLVSEALGYLQARLTQAEWWLLWMFHGEGYSCREMSKKLDLAYGTVRNRLSEARRHAMTILAPDARYI
jgi:RNA polymerase sigma factor (sigma-70 family)